MDQQALAMSAEDGAFCAGFCASARALLTAFEFMDGMASSNLEIPDEPPQEFLDMMEDVCGIPLPQTPPNLAESRSLKLFPPGVPQPVTPPELLNGTWTPTAPTTSEVECMNVVPVGPIRSPITPPELFLQPRLWKKDGDQKLADDIVPQTPPMDDDDDLDSVMRMVPCTPPGVRAPYTPLMTPPNTPPGTPPRSFAGTPPGTPPMTPPPSPVSEGKHDDDESTQSTKSTAASPCSPTSNVGMGGQKRKAKLQAMHVGLPSFGDWKSLNCREYFV